MNRKKNGFTTAKLVIAIAIIVIAVIAILVTVLIPRGHTHTPSAELTVVKTPTCTTPGVAHTLCADCGEVLEEVALPATGKHIGEPISEIPATCTSTGLTAGEKCADCGAILVAQQEIPVLTHTYDDKYDANCNVCDHVRDVECRHVDVETLKKVEPTCTVAGKTEGKKCKTCGEILTAQTLIEKLPHTYLKAVTAPTCVEKGYTTYTCACGDSYVADYVNATGEHIYDDQYDATCNTCDHVRVAACRHDDVETLKKVEPTCTAAGKTEGKKCKTCGEVLTAQTLIEKLPHTYSKAITAPTCAEKGCTTYTCACGESYVADYVNATGKHNYADGYCTHCGAEDPDPDRKAIREAEKAYADYKTANSGIAPEYMLYEADSRFVALHKGAPKGVYASGEDALKALVGDLATRYRLTSATDGLYICTQSISYAGKTISILGDSISTFDGVSNDSTVNATIKNNKAHYPSNYPLTRADTWWQQVIDETGMQLCVNNSFGGSWILSHENSGGYGDRCVNLHNDQTGEEPDVIVVYMGTNDFGNGKATFGKADDINYQTLIVRNADATFTYTKPNTTCEAYAIMLHKIQQRYPDAEIFCMTLLPDRNPDHPVDGRGYGSPAPYNAELRKVIAHFDCALVDLEYCVDRTGEIFDQHFADHRIHPSEKGMDAISDTLLSVMMGK